MCGIAGMQIKQGVVADRKILQQMNDLVAHRGPDGDGFFHEKNVGLGNRRLSIIDLEGGDQPIFNEDESVVIVFNGEIYNSPELRDELISQGHQFRTHCDTEVVIHLYEEHGTQMLHRLRGMFALAMYNRHTRELLIARDALGIKPLFYAELDDGFYFSSELRSLLSLDNFLRKIDPEAFKHYVTLNYIPAPKTIWQDAKRLEPGHWIKLRDGEVIDQGRFFKIDKSEQDQDLDELISKLDQTLNDSVKAHLLSDVPVGAFLSGGLDSSLVTALAQRQTSEQLQTYTVSFPEYPTYDESKYARIVADAVGTEHCEIPVTAAEGSASMLETLNHLDEPFADSSLVPVGIISKATRKHVKVALSGDGGDELFAGYNKYQGLWFAERYRAAAPLMKLASKLPFAETRGTKLGERWRQFRKLSRMMSPDPMETHLRATASLEPGLRERLLQSHLGNGDALQSYLGNIWSEGRESGYDGIDLSLYTDVNFVLPYDMLHKVDVSSMQHSLEVRVPFVDPVVTQMAFQIPHQYKLRDGKRKWILHKVAEKYLPKSILTRPKGGFGIPIGEWFRDDLHDAIRDLLSPQKLKESGAWNTDCVSQLLDEHFSMKRDRFWEIWNIFVFEWWRREWNPHW